MDFVVVRTIENKCRRCYNCVRYCPSKAIKVENGQAVVIPDRCIGCGNCVKVCTQNAKEVHSSIDRVKELLQSGRKVAACIAPSFPAELDDDIVPGQLVAAYKKIGFTYVVEVAFGADLISRQYKALYEENSTNYITSSCPAVCYYIQKYHPELTENLTPMVSPMIATAMVVKEEYGKDVAVVFIGPCIAKKYEARTPELSDLIDGVITFQESRILREEMGAGNFAELEPMSFDPPHPSWGRAFAVTGGTFISSDIENNILDYRIETVDGRERFLDFINEFEAGRANCKMVEILFCEGCINGPMMTGSSCQYSRKRKVAEYVSESKRDFDLSMWQYYIKKYETSLDFYREFTPQVTKMQTPTKEEVQAALHSMRKYTKRDELNCKSCGYESCQDLAWAICAGIAEKEMCISFTIEELEITLKDLHESNLELERSHQELQQTQQQLIQTEKLASMGQLAAGIAHELNNPLGSIILYSELLAKEAENEDSTMKDLKFIANEAIRCKNIVSGLLDFSRQREVFCGKEDLNGLIKETMEVIVSQKDRPHLEYDLQLGSDLPLIEIDARQIKQLLINFIMNAIEAMEEKGKLTVRTEYLSDRDRIVTKISDTGPGIPQENLKRIFTPFFTTKQIGSGTGLGLAICYGIIKMHRGDINIDTEIGKGTTFKIDLPRLHSKSNKDLILGDIPAGERFTAGYQPRRFLPINTKEESPCQNNF